MSSNGTSPRGKKDKFRWNTQGSTPPMFGGESSMDRKSMLSLNQMIPNDVQMGENIIVSVCNNDRCSHAQIKSLPATSETTVGELLDKLNAQNKLMPAELMRHYQFEFNGIWLDPKFKLRDYKVKSRDKVNHSLPPEAPLHVALAVQSVDVMERLAGAKEEVMNLDQNGRTLWHCAAMCDSSTYDKEVVKTLLKRKISLLTKDKDGRTAVFYAINTHKWDMVNVMLRECPAAFAVTDAEMRYPSHCLCSVVLTQSEKKDKDTLLKLLKDIVEVAPHHYRDSQGNFPVHYAAMTGNIDFVSFFVNDVGIPPDLRNQRNQTPLYLAVLHKEVALAAFLVKVAGANPCIISETKLPLDIADMYEDIDMAKHLRMADISIGAELDQAIRENDLELFKARLVKRIEADKEAEAKRILASQPPPNVHKQPQGFLSHIRAEEAAAEASEVNLAEKHAKALVALISECAVMAAIRGNLEVVEYLIDHELCSKTFKLNGEWTLWAGLVLNQMSIQSYISVLNASFQNVSFEVRMKHGMTPLLMAILAENWCAIQLMLSKGISINQYDAMGRTELHYAVLTANMKIMRDLLNIGCDPMMRSLNGETVIDLAMRLQRKDFALVFRHHLGEQIDQSALANCGFRLPTHVNQVTIKLNRLQAIIPMENKARRTVRIYAKVVHKLENRQKVSKTAQIVRTIDTKSHAKGLSKKIIEEERKACETEVLRQKKLLGGRFCEATVLLAACQRGDLAMVQYMVERCNLDPLGVHGRGTRGSVLHLNTPPPPRPVRAAPVSPMPSRTFPASPPPISTVSARGVLPPVPPPKTNGNVAVAAVAAPKKPLRQSQVYQSSPELLESTPMGRTGLKTSGGSSGIAPGRMARPPPPIAELPPSFLKTDTPLSVAKEHKHEHIVQYINLWKEGLTNRKFASKSRRDDMVENMQNMLFTPNRKDLPESPNIEIDFLQSFDFVIKKDREYYREMQIYVMLDNEHIEEVHEMVGRVNILLDFASSRRPEYTLTLFNRDGPTAEMTVNLHFKETAAEKLDANEKEYVIHDPLEEVNKIKRASKCKRIGKARRHFGAVPKYPVMIVPGLASSALEAWQTKEKDWQCERVWIDPFKIGKLAVIEKVSQKVFSRGSGAEKKEKKEKKKKKEKEDKTQIRIDKSDSKLPASKDTEEEGEDLSFLENMEGGNAERKRKWIEHMTLLSDGFSDPPDIKVRAVPGLHGIDFLASVSVAKAQSYVFGHVIRMLIDFGYDPSNLDACSYDWRLPPEKLQDRDNYFGMMQKKIEGMVEHNGEKCVLMAHSMGNRVVQYFLKWLVWRGQQEWIDHNIHAFLAMGAPFLGSAKAIRTVLCGDAMGLEVFLTKEESLFMARRAASLPWLFPVNESSYPDDIVRTNSSRTVGAGSDLAFTPVPFTKLLQNYVPRSLRYYEAFYVNNPLYLLVDEEMEEPPVLEPPPIDRIWVLNGINRETEVGYYFKDSTKPVLDNSADKYSGKKLAGLNPRGLLVREGIAFENSKTFQPSFKSQKSGDGTVPFCSLNYAETAWARLPDKHVFTSEVEDAEHREMLNHEGIFNKIIDFLCTYEAEDSSADPPDAQTLLSNKTLSYLF